MEYFDPSGQGITLAQARALQEVRPLQVQTSGWPAPAVPSIASVSAVGTPFRLKVSGSGFRQGCSVKISGTLAPETVFKNQSLVVAKGSGLKAMVPKGAAVNVEVVSPDGTTSAPFSFTR